MNLYISLFQALLFLGWSTTAMANVDVAKGGEEHEPSATRAMANVDVAKGGEEHEPSATRALRGSFYGRGKGTSSALGMVVVPSENSFEETYDTLVAALKAVAPISVIAEIDHANAASEALIEPQLPPNRLVVFGNPTLGTPIMQENARAGLDLPQKMLVWEDFDGKVFLGYNPPEYLSARYDGIEDVVQLATIGGALKTFASQATGVAVDDIEEPPSYHFDKVNRLSGGWFSVESNTNFEDTYSRLVTAIENADGPSIAFEVDHEANSGGVLNPLRLVVFGNPQLGTPLMLQSSTAGIDLPLKILVSADENGKVYVTSNKIGFLEIRHHLRGVKDNILAARTAVLNFVSVASGVEFK